MDRDCSVTMLFLLGANLAGLMVSVFVLNEEIVPQVLWITVASYFIR